MPQPTPELIDLTIRTLEDHRLTLMDQRKSIEDKILGVDEQIQQWRIALKEVSKENDGGGIPRKKRGDNARLIGEWYDAHEGFGFTITELMSATGLPNSSVHNVVAKEGSGFWKDEDGKYWRGEPPQEPLNGASLSE